MESQRPNANIIDLKSRSSGLPFPELFSEVRGLAFRRLPAMLAEVLDQADDALFDFVQKSSSSLEQQAYFDAMRELRRQRSTVELRYREHLVEAFAALERRKPLVASFSQVQREGTLSLVDPEQLEEQLAAEQLSAAAERRHGEALRQLHRRFIVLTGMSDLDEHALPLGPAHVTLAFRAGMGAVDATLHARLVLYKLFERELLSALGTLLHEANLQLHQAGVAGDGGPGARPPARPAVPRAGVPGQQSRDLGVPGAGAPAGMPGGAAGGHAGAGRGGFGMPGRAGAAGPGQPGQPGEAYAGGADYGGGEPDDMYVAVRDMFAAYLDAQRERGRAQGDAMPRVNLAGRDALSALSLLQHDLPSEMMRAVDDPQLSLGTLLKQELLKQASRMGMGGPDAGLVAQDEQALLLVGMLFDVLLSQRSYQRSVREQFVRLSVPYAKAAMLDQRLFAQKSHPARRLLNSLAEACDGNQGESSAERDLLSRVEAVSDRLVADFNEDIAIFAELEAEFRQFFEQHRKRTDLAEKRAAEAQRGRERLDEARARAAADLVKLLDGRDAPPAIDQFLNRYWTHHLAVTALRDGEDGSRYADARAAGELLWTAFRECEQGAEPPAEMRARLTPVLASSGVAGQQADDILDALEWVLQALRLGRADVARQHALPVDVEPRSSMPAAQADAPALQLTEPAAPAGDAVPKITPAAVAAAASLREREAPQAAAPAAAAAAEPPAPPADAFEASDVERIRALEVGTWVEFIGDDGVAQPAKLSWVSPISGRLLFVNRRGMRLCASSPEELAVQIKQHKLVLRSGDAAFERAMSQILGRLREAVPVR